MKPPAVPEMSAPIGPMTYSNSPDCKTEAYCLSNPGCETPVPPLPRESCVQPVRSDLETPQMFVGPLWGQDFFDSHDKRAVSPSILPPTWSVKPSSI